MASLQDLQLNKALYRQLDAVTKALAGETSQSTAQVQQLQNIVYPDNIVVNGDTNSTTLPSGGGSSFTPGDAQLVPFVDVTGSLTVDGNFLYDSSIPQLLVQFISVGQLETNVYGIASISTLAIRTVSDDIHMYTGTGGQISIETSVSTATGSASISIKTGDAAVGLGSFDSADITLETGTSNDAHAGSVNLLGGFALNGASGGEIRIESGSGDANSAGGGISLFAGDSGNLFSAGLNNGGSVVIEAGDSGDGAAGSVIIVSGASTESGISGRIRLTLGGTNTGTRSYFQFSQLDAFGNIQPNIAFSNNTPTFGGGAGMLYIRNRTTAPSSDPTSGGLLYVESGALMFRGSGGTVTTVAPA